MELYHLDFVNRNGEVVSPAIPSNWLIEQGYEDGSTPRVCMAPSIELALRAMSMSLKDKTLYVHKAIVNHGITIPTTKLVPDVTLTHEVWVTKPVKFTCIGIINVKDAKIKGHKYRFGMNHTAELFDWLWEWAEQYDSEAVTRYADHVAHE